MKPLEGKKVLVVLAGSLFKELGTDNLVETKYQRIGHIDEGRLCDKLVGHCMGSLYGAPLPPRWRYSTAENFVTQFGKGVKWSNTRSYQGCFADGQYAFRIWTNAGKKYAWVDIPEHLIMPLSVVCDIEIIPTGSLHKCRPFAHRAKVTSTSDIDLLVTIVKDIYGV